MKNNYSSTINPEKGFIVLFMMSLLFLIAVLTFSMTSNIESDIKTTQNFKTKQESLLTAEAVLPAIEQAIGKLDDLPAVTSMSVATQKIAANEIFVWEENVLKNLSGNEEWEKQSQQWWSEHGLSLAAIDRNGLFANNPTATAARFVVVIKNEISNDRGVGNGSDGKILYEITLRIKNEPSVSTIKSTYKQDQFKST